MRYGEFCPIAKATEIVGERWTILIIRELIMGGRKFNQLQRGLGGISPALLTSRLKFLEDQGLVMRKRISGQRGYEYFPTPACEALLPSLITLGEWGLLWARDTLTDADLDIELLMLYLERSIDPAMMAGARNVIQFKFRDLKDQQSWWLLVSDDSIDVCLIDPGKDVDVYFFTTVRTMHDVWMGDRSYRDAMQSGDLIIEGEPALVGSVQRWLRPSKFADAPRAPLPEVLGR